MVLNRKNKHKLLNSIKEQDYHDIIEKFYLFARDLSEPKYQFLIKKCKDAGIKHVNNQVHLLCVQIRWMMFTRILIITAQKEIKKSLNCL